jgi:hypothetical protein
LEVIFYADNKDQFLSLLNETSFVAPTPDQLYLRSEYNRHYFSDKFKDSSFIFLEKGKVKSVVPCHIINDVLCMDGSGIKPYYEQEDKRVIKAIYETLLLIASKNSIPTMLIRDNEMQRELGIWGAEAYKNGAFPKSLLKAEIDLSLSDEKIHRGVRDSYRSLINQAKRELDICVIDSNSVSREIFENFQKFHVDISGRETRSQESWDILYQMIKGGCAELLVAYLEPYGLVSCSLFTDYADTTTYAVAVYNRDLFDKPLAHGLVYESIFRAKKRNKKTFYLGLLPHASEVSAKEFSISQFKKGFCDRPSHCIEWSVNFRPKQNSGSS